MQKNPTGSFFRERRSFSTRCGLFSPKVTTDECFPVVLTGWEVPEPVEFQEIVSQAPQVPFRAHVPDFAE